MTRTSKHDFGCCHHPHCWLSNTEGSWFPVSLRIPNGKALWTVNTGPLVVHKKRGNITNGNQHGQNRNSKIFQCFHFFARISPTPNGKIDLQWPTGPLSNADIWIIRPFSMKSVKFDLDKTITLGEQKIQSVPKLNHFTLAPSCTGIRNGDGK